MLDFRQSWGNSALRKVLKRPHYPLEVMLTCVRWYVAYPLSLRHVEEMMQERGVFVDHSTVHRWAINLHDVPEKIAIDKSGANTAAIESVKAGACVGILMRRRFGRQMRHGIAAFGCTVVSNRVATPVSSTAVSRAKCAAGTLGLSLRAGSISTPLLADWLTQTHELAASTQPATGRRRLVR